MALTLPSLNPAVPDLAHPSALDIAAHADVDQGLGACALDTIQQDMERLPQGVRRLAVQLRLELDHELIWTVITDYENLSGFIPNLASSRLLWRRGSQVGLEQVGCQQFCGLRFSARVELELVEQREDGVLRFRMTQGDFRRFEGSWTVSRDSNGARLLYELTVQGRPGMPIGLIEQRLREDLAANLRAVQQEALQRSGKQLSRRAVAG